MREPVILTLALRTPSNSLGPVTFRKLYAILVQDARFQVEHTISSAWLIGVVEVGQEGLKCHSLRSEGIWLPGRDENNWKVGKRQLVVGYFWSTFFSKRFFHPHPLFGYWCLRSSHFDIQLILILFYFVYQFFQSCIHIFDFSSSSFFSLTFFFFFTLCLLFHILQSER